MVRPFRWDPDRKVLHLLDQRRLPSEEVWIECAEAHEVADAIQDMVVRGAPAIGVAAAYAVVLGFARDGTTQAAARFEGFAALLFSTRPTAVNLGAAVRRMRARFETLRSRPGDDTRLGPRRRGRPHRRRRPAGEPPPRGTRRRPAASGEGPARVLTHCNAGSLATSGYGTALGIVRALAESGREVEVFAPETRPYLQGARLTAWELMADGIPVTLVTDGMVGSLLAAGDMDAVAVGADRIAANGDSANKIGTYQAAVLAKEHGVPFLVAAPFSSVDLETPTGAEIPIEERGPEEVVEIAGRRIAPEGVPVWNPAFDVTPARYITAIVTERGIARPPFEASLRNLASRA